MLMKNIFMLLVLSMIITACNDKSSDSQNNSENYEFALPEWASNATIYEVNTRHMTPEGNFKALQTHLERIRAMNVDILWLMPIHPISVEKRKATNDLFLSDIEDPEERKNYLGSPYSVADYRAINPDYGTMEDFKVLLAKAHELGMKLIIDWVPNHTGWDHPWITEHPDWYTQDADGNIIDPIDYNTGKSWGWVDVADLNYDNEEMRQEMIATMKFWIEEIGIDGFRVDVAHGIPQDFWDEACPELVKANPDIFLLAESAVPSNLNNKTFHADYGWSLHHLLNEIARSEKKASEIDEWLRNDRETYKEGFHMHFTSNHDENTWAGTVFERMGDAHLTMAAFTVCFEGMPLLYSGMEEPMRKRLAFFTKDTIGFKDYAYSDFYTKLFDLKHNNKALGNGSYGGALQKWFDDENIFAFSRENEGDRIIAVFNMSADDQSFSVPEDVDMVDAQEFTEVKWSEGDKISLAPWQYIILSNPRS